MSDTKKVRVFDIPTGGGNTARCWMDADEIERIKEMAGVNGFGFQLEFVKPKTQVLKVTAQITESEDPGIQFRLNINESSIAALYTLYRMSNPLGLEFDEFKNVIGWPDYQKRTQNTVTEKL